MPLATAFWVLMLIWLVFGLAWNFGYLGSHGPLGSTLLLFFLFLVLGWSVFGPPLKG